MRHITNSRSLILSIIFLFATLPFPAVADEKTDTLDLVPRWNSGEKFRYELVLSGRETKNGKITMETTTTTPVVIEVLEANDKGYALGWTMGETRFQDPKQAANPFIKAMCGLFQDFQTILEIDRSATFAGVKNWKELQAHLDRAMNLIADFLKQTDVKESDIELIVKEVKSTYATKEGAETISTKEARIFLAAIGESYPLVGAREIHATAANPFGGEPFPFRVELRVKQIDKARDIVTVTSKQTIDPVAGKDVLEKTGRDMAKRMGKPLPQEPLLKWLSMDADSECTIQLSTGWPLSIRHAETIKQPGIIRINTTTFSRMNQ